MGTAGGGRLSGCPFTIFSDLAWERALDGRIATARLCVQLEEKLLFAVNLGDVAVPGPCSRVTRKYRSERDH